MTAHIFKEAAMLRDSTLDQRMFDAIIDLTMRLWIMTPEARENVAASLEAYDGGEIIESAVLKSFADGIRKFSED
jgi:hypothetical protein